jgi:predicted nucleic acid-binding protein
MSFTIGHDKIFLDSNISIYLLGSNELKKEKVERLIDPSFVISTQVIAENINVCLKKLKFTKERAFEHGNFLMTKNMFGI